MDEADLDWEGVKRNERIRNTMDKLHGPHERDLMRVIVMSYGSRRLRQPYKEKTESNASVTLTRDINPRMLCMNYK